MNSRATLIKRDIGYTFWVFAEQAAYLGLPRLVLFPVAAYLIGKEGFGIFSIALSITLLIGMQPQNGLATGLLRHLPEYEDRQSAALYGTAMRMSHWVMSAIVAVGLIATVITGCTDVTSRRLLNCLFPLVILLYVENQFLLILTDTRFLRRFRQRAIWVAGCSISGVICGTIGAIVGDAPGLAWGYLLGNAAFYVVIRLRRESWFRAAYNREMAAVLRADWLHITIAGILTVSIPHINRIVLGAYHSYDSVADFVAATTIMFVYLAPTACFGGLILSMLSRYSSASQLSRRGRTYYAAVLFFGVLILPVLMFLTGPAATRLLFPQFGQASVDLLRVLVWVVPSEAIACLTRPFIYKFAPARVIPIINLVSVVIILVLAFLLIPRYAAKGAAWGYVVGNTLTALVWVLVCTRLFLVAPSDKNAGDRTCCVESPAD